MRAVVYKGPGAVSVEDLDEPTIQSPTDALVAVRCTAICASDLHLISGKTPGAREGAVIGHEFVGIITDMGDQVAAHHDGTRVLGSFLIACGSCASCAARAFNFCKERRALGLGQLTGDLDGAQADVVRIPNADVNLKQLSGGLSGLTDEQAVFGGDVLTTGYYAADVAEITPDDKVVVVGAGPVGLSCALAARLRGPARLTLLDPSPTRVTFAQGLGFEAVDVSEQDAQVVVASLTEGAMADVAIDAVGHTDAFKSAMKSVREGGRVIVVGVYGTERYDLPMGMTWVRGLRIHFAGMANIQAHWDDALFSAAKGEVDPSRLVTHTLPLEQAPEGYEVFEGREAIKVLLKP